MYIVNYDKITDRQIVKCVYKWNVLFQVKFLKAKRKRKMCLWALLLRCNGYKTMLCLLVLLLLVCCYLKVGFIRLFHYSYFYYYFVRGGGGEKIWIKEIYVNTNEKTAFCLGEVIVNTFPFLFFPFYSFSCFLIIQNRH